MMYRRWPLPILLALLVSLGAVGCAERRASGPQPQASSSQMTTSESSAPKPSEDVPDPDTLRRRYIQPLGGLVWHSWDSPEQLHLPSLFLFCVERGNADQVDYEQFLNEAEGGLYRIPAALFDGYVTQYFGAEQPVLHGHPSYSAEADAYLDGLDVGGGPIEIDHLHVEINGSVRTITFSILGNDPPFDPVAEVTLKVETDGERWHYLSNHVSEI